MTPTRRVATPAETPVVQAILTAAFADYVAGLGLTPSDYPWLPARVARGDAFLYRLGDRDVAALLIGTYEGAGYIDHVAVLPQMQGAGLGRRLVQDAEALLAARGHTRAVLRTAAAYSHLVRFYEHRGYRVFFVGPSDSDTSRHDRAWMEKPLPPDVGATAPAPGSRGDGPTERSGGPAADGPAAEGAAAEGADGPVADRLGERTVP